ncbi:hypothetical protein RJ639_005443 [Escallonia herrerae]|uniref:BED-type domain-containing protein n=1 Tax=Escallonia herrerae TaxID=1293975 RepID=A0AA88VVX3_9ASTE|nr:hypothetical protein RJ639_005443 [Escallonia herrerae]
MTGPQPQTRLIMKPTQHIPPQQQPAQAMVDDAGAVGAGGSGNSCPLPPRPPKRKKETSTREPSQVWDHFQKIKRNTPSEPDPEIIICKYCSKRYGYTGANGTRIEYLENARKQAACQLEGVADKAL